MIDDKFRCGIVALSKYALSATGFHSKYSMSDDKFVDLFYLPVVPTALYLDIWSVRTML